MVQLETSLADAYAAAGAAEQAVDVRGPRRAAQGGRATLSLGRATGRVHRLPLARGQAQRRAHRRDAAPLFFGLATQAQARRVAAGGPRPPAAAGRSRDHHREHGPAMGCAQRLGAAAVDGGRGPEPLRRDRRSPRPSRERWMAKVITAYRSDRQAGREVQRRRRPGRGRRRRVPDAGRLRLDQRRAAQAARSLPGCRSPGRPNRLVLRRSGERRPSARAARRPRRNRRRCRLSPGLPAAADPEILSVCWHLRPCCCMVSATGAD